MSITVLYFRDSLIARSTHTIYTLTTLTSHMWKSKYTWSDMPTTAGVQLASPVCPNPGNGVAHPGGRGKHPKRIGWSVADHVGFELKDIVWVPLSFFSVFFFLKWFTNVFQTTSKIIYKSCAQCQGYKYQHLGTLEKSKNVFYFLKCFVNGLVKLLYGFLWQRSCALPSK